MGDCTSRPTEAAIQDFSLTFTHKHDKKFFNKIELPYIKDIVECKISSAEQRDLYRAYATRLQADIQVLNLLKDTQKPQSGPSRAYLALEIVKGVHIYPRSSCIQGARPFVTARVHPAQTIVQTKLRDPILPKFNQYFEIEVNRSSFEFLEVKVFMARRVGEPIEYGKVTLPFDYLQDYEARSEWFDLQGSLDDIRGKPRLYMRLQFIPNLSAMLSSHLSAIEDLINAATRAFVLCKRQLSNDMIS